MICMVFVLGLLELGFGFWVGVLFLVCLLGFVLWVGFLCFEFVCFGGG